MLHWNIQWVTLNFLERYVSSLSYIGEILHYTYTHLQNKERDIYANATPFFNPASNENQLYAQLQSFGIKTIHHEELE